MFDGKAFGGELVDLVKGYVSRVLQPFEIRMAVLEAREPMKGDKGDSGRDGRDGADGKDGADGLGFEDFAIDYDGERTLTFRFRRGEKEKQFQFKMPAPLYRGVYQPAEAYERGDTVTFGGSLWHCNAETTDKPGEGATAWTLAAKRGRDGKAGKDGTKGDKGQAGRAGHDSHASVPGPAQW